MANAKKCDRCNSYYDDYRGVRVKWEGAYYKVNRVNLASFCNNICLDLCPSCVKTIASFLVEVVEDEGSEEE